jgi:hypothetical protein
LPKKLRRVRDGKETRVALLELGLLTTSPWGR